ncbi:TetR/AcrR family transcriptional regulator [Rhodococcus sp. P1Y]|nr:TetR/AcrR family transcriptional regulator [Rhodococcus sp. P1Y]
MGTYTDRVKATLVDAAEELFATHGIDAVSSRQIAEHAGNANHSAVNYHFGGRDGLLAAIVRRQAGNTAVRRREMVESLRPDPQLHDLLRCLILPLTDQLEAAGRVSWHARFIRQLRTSPSSKTLLTDAAADAPIVEDLLARVRESLSDIPTSVLTARFWMLGLMVVDVCAEYESRVQERSVDQPDWLSLARFLVDACVGTLSAEVTSETQFLDDSRSAVWL